MEYVQCMLTLCASNMIAVRDIDHDVGSASLILDQYYVVQRAFNDAYVWMSPMKPFHSLLGSWTQEGTDQQCRICLS